MIDVVNEHLLTFSMAAKLRPPSRGGRPTHPSTLARWALRGVRGVRLETIRLGGSVYTSKEALQRFAERLSDTDGTARQTRLSTRQGAIKAADEKLEQMGY